MSLVVQPLTWPRQHKRDYTWRIDKDRWYPGWHSPWPKQYEATYEQEGPGGWAIRKCPLEACAAALEWALINLERPSD